jgi:hypothetical protein
MSKLEVALLFIVGATVVCLYGLVLCLWRDYMRRVESEAFLDLDREVDYAEALARAGRPPEVIGHKVGQVLPRDPAGNKSC